MLPSRRRIMFNILAFRLFVKSWKKAIKISDKLSTAGWKRLLLLSILMLPISIYGWLVLSEGTTTIAISTSGGNYDEYPEVITKTPQDLHADDILYMTNGLGPA